MYQAVTEPIDRRRPARTPEQGRGGRGRGFSLIELLVVIVIIATIISILIPAIAGARTAARRAATMTLGTGITQAAKQFELDRGRMPGYFTPEEMGQDQNGDTNGFSAMENVMLDLIGSAAIVDQGADGAVEVGPFAAASDNIFINPTLIGADEGAYYELPPEYTEQLVNGGAGDVQQFGDESMGHILDPGSGEESFPDVVDAFGAPLLAWVADADATPQEIEDFAELSSDDDTRGDDAVFYWNSNAAFLRADSIGFKFRDQTAGLDASPAGSLLGPDAAGSDEDSFARVMAAILGNPGFPSTLDRTAPNFIYPTVPRGGFILHSAGPDNVYLSARDSRLGRYIDADPLTEDGLTYERVFFAGDTRRTGDDGQPEQIDLATEAFDDMILSAQ